MIWPPIAKNPAAASAASKRLNKTSIAGLPRSLARVCYGDISMAGQPCFAALDVSLEKTTICVMSLDGNILREAVVTTDPEAIANFLAVDREKLERIGLEAGPLSEWLVRGLADRGITAVLMETRQVRAALSAMIVKTDRKDARGMAHLLRMGWFRPVHVKTMDAREQRCHQACDSP
jgi:hypothetical protein